MTTAEPSPAADPSDALVQFFASGLSSRNIDLLIDHAAECARLGQSAPDLDAVAAALHRVRGTDPAVRPGCSPAPGVEMCIFGLMSPTTGLDRCVLPPRHDGQHRTAAGREWADLADNPGDLSEIDCPF